MQIVQETFADLGTPLHETTFVVVDLETTGGSPTDCHITEVGAVKVRGGEVLGEFQTLVRPREPIPAFITVLTGISNPMVADAPPIESVLPAFLEFASGAVLVAHNAGFDISFLKAAAAATGHPWPQPGVVDTVRLARQLVHRDEAPNHRLASLARLFGSATEPNHRALQDARATVDVLHGLIERVGNLGVHTLEELRSYSARVSSAQRRKRFLAEAMPSAPGVYIFKDDTGEPLYVGTATDIRRRTMSYFTASEGRRRIAEMVGIATSITPIVCPTPIEAQVRELRLIAEHRPRYNRRSKHPERTRWVKLTSEPFPRLSIVRQMRDDGAVYAGPFGSQTSAQDAIDAVHEVVPLRRCTTRLSTKGNGSACILAELGKCGAPCTGAQSRDEYAPIAERAEAMLRGDGRGVIGELRDRLTALAAAERFEDAMVLRERMLALVRAAARGQRVEPIRSAAELLAARRTELGGWELVCIRYGRLAGTRLCPRGTDPMAAIEALQASAEVVPAPVDDARAALPEETEVLAGWLESPGVRLVHLHGDPWTCPVGGAGQARAWLDSLAKRWRAHPVAGAATVAG